jgi:phospholipid/cholesterol/gamma-HCH transport system substrate-binding protein
MLFGKTKLELKVGIFVFFGLVILTVFVLSIGGFKTWASGYRIKFVFNFINGVKLGAPVRFAGLDVGQVKEIKLIPIDGQKTQVVVDSWVTNQVRIPVDSTIWVNTLGLLGEKYIEIMPGKDAKNILPAGGTLIGKDPLAMHEVGELAKKIADDIDALIVKIKSGEGTLGKLFSDDALYTELESLVLDLKQHPWKLFWKGKE